MDEKQIKDKDFENIALEETPLCRFCSQSTDETMIRVCKCEGVLQWVHFTCLSAHIKKTRKESCALCKSAFIGITIENVPLGFCTFIKVKEDIIPQMICSTVGFIFLYYILYLALIDYILSEGLIHAVLRMLLIVPTVLYAILFTILLIGSVVTLFMKYKKWSENNHSIKVILVPKKTESQTTVPKNGSQGQKEKTAVCPKNEEKPNERVAIDMEGSQSKDNKSEQTVKVNTTDGNQLNVEIRQKGQ